MTAGVVDAVGQPPELAYFGNRWWDLRTRDLPTLSIVGWFPVVESQRPVDTASMTWEPVFTFAVAEVVQTWAQIPKTPEQLAAEADATARATIEQALDAALVTLQTVIDDTNPNINSNPAARIKDLARAQRRTIRLLIRRFDGTS